MTLSPDHVNSISGPRLERAAGATRRARRVNLRVAAGAALMTVLAVPYMIALASPLRLSWDAIVDLSLARKISAGEPYKTGQAFPPGYPHLLAFLDRIGLGAPWAFVATNLMLLAVAVIASYLMFRRPFGFSRSTALFACCGILLVHDIVGVTVVPLSDMTFFGVAMLAVLLLDRSARLPGLHAAVAIAAAGVLAAVAFEVRTIGIALWPAVLFACLSRGDVRSRLENAVRRHPARTLIATAALLAVLGAVAFVGIAATGYPHVFEQGRTGSSVIALARSKLDALGDLTANVPASRWPAALGPLRAAAGAALLAVVGIGSIRRRKVSTPDVFALSTFLVLLAWPLDTPRLWIPVVPMLIGYGIVGGRLLARSPLFRLGLALYVAVFAAAGIAMLANSTRLSLSGREFADRWARQWPVLHATYEVAFCRASASSAGPVDAHALRLLRRYEALASSRCIHP
jgi:hypothetical protein